MYDPQDLTFVGKIRALTAMGRIPLASEVPVWTLLGCVLASQIFPSATSSIATTDSPSVFRAFHWGTVLRCMFITWASNVSINYSNEYFDYDVDRPSQVAAIEKDYKARKEIIADVKETYKGSDEDVKEIALKMKGEMMTKISGNTTKIIHDGTFPPYTALICSAAWQLAGLTVILASRASSSSSPFRGLALQIIAFGTFFSQEYIAPPLKLHYRGWGEVTSSFLMVPLDITFGLTAYYTASSNRPLHLSELPLLLDTQVWTLLLACWLFCQARILIMHIPDIEGDIRGGKMTMTARLGHRASAHLYAALNLLCITAFSSLLLQLFSKNAQSGLLTRVAGGLPLLSQEALRAHRMAWLTGLAVVSLYSLPIICIVYNSLLASAPGNAPKTNQKTGLLPVLRATTCAILVSLQLLSSPWILSGTVLLAARAGLNAR